MKRIAIAGAGLSGSVLAHLLAQTGRFQIDIFDERNHVAGNCYTYRDQASGILLHAYGPHIFHTKKSEIWNFVTKFVTMGAYTNRVKATTERGVFSLPINLLTINQFFGKKLSPSEAQSFIAGLGDKSIGEPKNFEEQALKLLGQDLYANFFRDYTVKQWGVDPKLLPAAILQRLPIRFDYNDNYFDDPFQGIPVEGYTVLIEKMLDHQNITKHLTTRFDPTQCKDYDYTFYSGTLDGFFAHRYGFLGYRNLRFERFDTLGDYQGNPVMNYCDNKTPYTRITEHKHFAPWEHHKNSVCFKEFPEPAAIGVQPFYPTRLLSDKTLLAQYVQAAQLQKNITFIGRLGTYRYIDMDACIGEMFELANAFVSCTDLSNFPAFSRDPLSNGAPAPRLLKTAS